MTSIFSVIVNPIVTEKTTSSVGKFVFKVDSRATKVSVKNAVKEFYGIDVVSVNIINLPEKTKTIARGRVSRKRAPFKKAIVTLKEGEKLDFNAFK